MERDELIERLKGYEWNDIEFKRARKGVPESAYETVSAFSNTAGGWLVFGIKDSAGSLRNRWCIGSRQGSKRLPNRLCVRARSLTASSQSTSA